MWSFFENTFTSVGYLPTDSNCKRIYLNIYVEVAVNYRRCHKKDLLAIWYNYSLFSYHAAVKREQVILTPKTLANCFNISFNIRLILWKLSPLPHPPPQPYWIDVETSLQQPFNIFFCFCKCSMKLKPFFPCFQHCWVCMCTLIGCSVQCIHVHIYL